MKNEWFRGVIFGAIVGYAFARVHDSEATDYYRRLRARLVREEGIAPTPAPSTPAAAEG